MEKKKLADKPLTELGQGELAEAFRELGMCKQDAKQPGAMLQESPTMYGSTDPHESPSTAAETSMRADGNAVENLLEMLRRVFPDGVPSATAKGKQAVREDAGPVDICDVVPDMATATAIMSGESVEVPLVTIYLSGGKKMKDMLRERKTRKDAVDEILASFIRDNMMVNSLCQSVMFSMRQKDVEESMKSGKGALHNALAIKHRCEHSVRGTVALMNDLDTALYGNLTVKGDLKVGVAVQNNPQSATCTGACHNTKRNAKKPHYTDDGHKVEGS